MRLAAALTARHALAKREMCGRESGYRVVSGPRWRNDVWEVSGEMSPDSGPLSIDGRRYFVRFCM